MRLRLSLPLPAVFRGIQETGDLGDLRLSSDEELSRTAGLILPSWLGPGLSGTHGRRTSCSKMPRKQEKSKLPSRAPTAPPVPLS